MLEGTANLSGKGRGLNLYICNKKPYENWHHSSDTDTSLSTGECHTTPKRAKRWGRQRGRDSTRISLWAPRAESTGGLCQQPGIPSNAQDSYSTSSGCSCCKPPSISLEKRTLKTVISSRAAGGAVPLAPFKCPIALIQPLKKTALLQPVTALTARLLNSFFLFP